MDELPEAPLDQPEPKYVDCPKCGGDGYFVLSPGGCDIDGENCEPPVTEPCPRCEGRGFVPNEEKNDER